MGESCESIFLVCDTQRVKAYAANEEARSRMHRVEGRRQIDEDRLSGAFCKEWEVA